MSPVVSPKAVRIRKSDGWADIALQGPPGPAGGEHELAYAQVTGITSITATTGATANTVVTAPAITTDGVQPIIVEFFAPECRPDGAAVLRVLSVYLYQDGALFGRLGVVQTPAANVLILPLRMAKRFTPAAGSHTYSIRASVNAGTGSIEGGDGATGNDVPGYIRISRVMTVPTLPNIPLVSALPASPVDGQECYYQADATNGVVWHLRYRSGATTYKWEFLGGPPLYAESNTEETVGAAWTAATNPRITVPLSGIYMVHGGARYTKAAAAGTIVHAGVGVLTEGMGGFTSMSQASTGGYVMGSGAPPERKGFAASQVAVIWMHGGAAGSAVGGRILTVTPIRVI